MDAVNENPDLKNNSRLGEGRSVRDNAHYALDTESESSIVTIGHFQLGRSSIGPEMWPGDVVGCDPVSS
jgi:hypothetical protein